MVTSAASSSSIGPSADSAIRHSSVVAPTTNAMTIETPNVVNTYQEEMCEKLIQLSFVKIVSSKSERGGARLRKNLLILHLLQRARLEQRNRLVAAARNAVASQHPEMKSASHEARANDDEEAGKDNQDCMETDHEEQRTERIDMSDASLRQQTVDERPPPTPMNLVCDEMTKRTEQDTQTTFTTDGAGVQDEISGTGSDEPDISNTSERSTLESHSLENKGLCQNDESDSALRQTSTPGVSNECAEKNNVDDRTARRQCLKRKHDSTTEMSSCYSTTTVDWNPASKIACVIHRTIEPVQQSQPNLNGFLSAFNKNNDENGNDEESGAESPLSRNLSCSSFMELTCES